MFALVALCSQPGTPSKLPDRRKSSFAGAQAAAAADGSVAPR